MCAQTEDRLNNEHLLNHRNYMKVEYKKDFVRNTFVKCERAKKIDYLFP